MNPEIEQQVKQMQGIRVDKHNGVFIVFLQRKNVTIRKMFSYRGKDKNPQEALQQAKEYRQQILSESFESFCKIKLLRKRKYKS